METKLDEKSKFLGNFSLSDSHCADQQLQAFFEMHIEMASAVVLLSLFCSLSCRRRQCYNNRKRNINIQLFIPIGVRKRIQHYSEN